MEQWALTAVGATHPLQDEMTLPDIPADIPAGEELSSTELTLDVELVAHERGPGDKVSLSAEQKLARGEVREHVASPITLLTLLQFLDIRHRRYTAASAWQYPGSSLAEPEAFVSFKEPLRRRCSSQRSKVSSWGSGVREASVDTQRLAWGQWPATLPPS